MLNPCPRFPAVSPMGAGSQQSVFSSPPGVLPSAHSRASTRTLLTECSVPRGSSSTWELVRITQRCQSLLHTYGIRISIFLKKINLFIYLFLAALGLRCCARAFSGCGAWAALRCGAQASHCGGFSCCGTRALGAQASVVVARGLQ